MFYLAREIEFLESIKVNEESNAITMSASKGNRKPADRATRRKKTAHAKVRFANTVRERESRAIPYSALFKDTKGKRHEKIWRDEKSNAEKRLRARGRADREELSEII